MSQHKTRKLKRDIITTQNQNRDGITHAQRLIESADALLRNGLAATMGEPTLDPSTGFIPAFLKKQAA